LLQLLEVEAEGGAEGGVKWVAGMAAAAGAEAGVLAGSGSSSSSSELLMSAMTAGDHLLRMEGQQQQQGK
jgi:hypothetical protein